MKHEMAVIQNLKDAIRHTEGIARSGREGRKALKAEAEACINAAKARLQGIRIK